MIHIAILFELGYNIKRSRYLLFAILIMNMGPLFL